MTQLDLSTPAVDVGPRARGEQPLPDPALFWSWVTRAARPWAGWVLAVAGFIVILVGWIGVSGQALVAKQLPYLISGGLGGVALVGVGVAMISAERRHQDADRIERLEEMVGELRGVLLAYADAPADWDSAPAGRPPAAGSGATASGATVSGATARYEAVGHTEQRPGSNGRAPGLLTGPVAIPTGTTYHAPDCQMVRGKDGVEAVGAAAIDRRGLSACRICEPALPGA